MAFFGLIGGKSNKEILDNRIEQYLISMTNKKCPTILYCPYAAINDIEKSNNKFKRQMNGLDCNIIYMGLDDINNFDYLLNKADILYIGGGHCDDLVELFIINNYYDVLLKYLNTDKIYAGVSAGAMIWCKYGMGDKYIYHDNFHTYNYKMVKCLGILDITICPHYQNDDLIIYNEVIKDYKLDSFGIEDDVALIINGNNYQIIKEDKRRSCYYFGKNNSFKMIPLYEGVDYDENCSVRS